MGNRFKSRHSGLKKGFLVVLLAVVVLVPLTAVIAPGAFRLLFVQPARDLVFFHREVQPFTNPSGIERHSPTPTRTVRLPVTGMADDEVPIELDVWLPEVTPAPVVILFHGASPRGRKLGFNMLLAHRLQQAGWLVLTPDTRGFGGSGKPRNPRDPAAWSVQDDNSRLVSFARSYPDGDGRVVAIGHSQGASYLLQAEHELPHISALVLIGPRRTTPDFEPDWWIRARFSSDRRIARMLPPQVMIEDLRRTDLLSFSMSRPEDWADTPVLLKDGAREGERELAILREASARFGPSAQHVTVPDSHHYCSAYQLPWPLTTVYVRPEVFNRCLEVIQEFLKPNGARDTRRPSP